MLKLSNNYFKSRKAKGGNEMMNWYGPRGGFILNAGMGLFGLIFMIVKLIIFVVLIAIAIRLFKKYYTRVETSKVMEDSAMAILRERFAKGEIDTEEFQKRKAELEQTKPM
jgi:putative membrane protein